MVRCNTECPPCRSRQRVTMANVGVAARLSTVQQMILPTIGAAIGPTTSVALPLLRLDAETLAVPILPAS